MAAQVELRIWPQLTPELTARVISRLPPNEVAATVRLINRAAAALFPAPLHAAVRLSRPVPTPAFAARWGGGLRATGSLSHRQRRLLASLTASTGVVINLQLAVAAAGLAPSPEPVAAAAAAAALPACEWLLAAPGADYVARAPVVLVAAARGGDVAACEWALTAARCPWSDAALATAADGGHAVAAEWLLARKPAEYGTIDYDIVLSAMARGLHLEALRRLSEDLETDRCRSNSGSGGDGGADADAVPLASWPGVLAAAAGSPTSDWQAKFEWRKSLPIDGYQSGQYDDGDGSVGAAAASAPDAMARLRWLAGGIRPGNVTAALAAAARGGNLEALTYLMTEEPYSSAVQLQYDEEPAIAAAAAGQLAALRLLHAHGAPAGVEAVRAAAWGGFLPVVAWLVGQAQRQRQQQQHEPEQEPEIPPPRPPDLPCLHNQRGQPQAQVPAEAQEAQSWEAVAAAAAQQQGGFVDAPLDPVLMERAAHSELTSLELVTWLRGRGCPWDEQALCAAAASGSLDTVAWMVEAGCPTGEATEEGMGGGGDGGGGGGRGGGGWLVASAARGGCVEMVEWLVAVRGCAMPAGWPYRAAAQNGDLAMLECLRRLGCPWDPPGHRIFTDCCGGGGGGGGSGSGRGGVSGAPLGALKWLLRAGCPVEWEAAVAAAAGRGWDAEQVLTWLQEERRQQGQQGQRQHGQ